MKDAKSGRKGKPDKDSDKKLQKMISTVILKMMTGSKTAEDTAAEEEQALWSYMFLLFCCYF